MSDKAETLDAELAAIERELEEAKRQAKEFNTKEERANRAACRREMWGAAVEARMEKGDPVASELLAEGRKLLPDLEWVGTEQVMKNDGYYFLSATKGAQVVWKKI